MDSELFAELGIDPPKGDTPLWTGGNGQNAARTSSRNSDGIRVHQGERE
jgi:hypothetical protein